MLTTNQIVYGVSHRQILKGVDFSVQEGECVGIIGPNGSGKSTFLKTIYKVLRPQSGEILLMNEDLLSMSNREMAQRMAVVVQEHESSFDFTVEEVIMMGRHARKRLLENDSPEDQALVSQILQLTRLSEIRDQGFSTLSGGEKQRVLIARALAQQTRLLILDEPTNHLDIKYQLQLMDLVRGLDRTVIAAIHDLNIAAMYCDRLYALKNGEMIACGTPEEVLTAPLIREVYEVNAEIFHDARGMLRVLFQPEGRP